MGKTYKSDPTDSRLIHAIRKHGTVDSVEAVVREFPGITKNQALLENALFASSQLNKPELVCWLLDHDISINLASHKRTPLMVAGSREVAEALLDKIPSLLNAADEDGKTALMQTKSVEVAELLLDRRARIDEVDKLGNTALLNMLLAKEVSHRTAHVKIAKLLIASGADVNAADPQGRTVLVTAIWKSYIEIVEILLNHPKLDVTQLDVRGRNVLHHFCQDAKRVLRYPVGDSKQHDQRIIVMLLNKFQHSKDMNLQEKIEGKTPLHCALLSGNTLLVHALLDHTSPPKVDVQDYSDKSALHVAAENGQHELVDKLVRLHGADLNLQTADEWTALHFGVAGSFDSVETVRALITERTELNKVTKLGKTALHIAAEVGNIGIVRHLLKYCNGSRTIDVTKRDVFGNSALICAAKAGHREIVGVLAQFSGPALDTTAKKAAEEIRASVVDFDPERRSRPLHTRHRVFDLIFGSPPVSLEQERFFERRDSLTESHHEEQTSTGFRWVHLPANNVFWCRGILIKLFLENNNIDGETLQTLLKSFDHNHQGKHLHARYMRPTCHYTPRNKETTQHTRHVSTSLSMSTRASDHTEHDDDRLHHSINNNERKARSSKSVPAKRRRHGHEDSTDSIPATIGPSDSAVQDPIPQDPYSNDENIRVGPESLYVFMPYLHFESFADRKKMSRAVRWVQGSSKEYRGLARMAAEYTTSAVLRPPIFPINREIIADEKLIHAYTTSDNATLQIRRTLDQFFYRTIDTTKRDKDQVVHRHQKRMSQPETTDEKTGNKTAHDANILMVDQLWMWVVNDNLVITSFPRRWGRDNDNHGVFEGIFRDVQSNTNRPVSDVYELAMIITGHCFGWIDRRESWHEPTLFFDMFESSIGHAMDREVKLFRMFRKATKEASSWLQKIRGYHHDEVEEEELETPHISLAEDDEDNEEYGDEIRGSEPTFVQTLLDIGDETRLLEEVKDIRDELDMLRILYNQQKELVPDIEKHILNILVQQKGTESQQARIKQLHEDQMKHILNPLRDIERMDQQAIRIYRSIRDLLDLKQKHANAMQATETQRQGKTLMVFTIVTVVFLPLSFLAAFFAINVTELPHDNEGHTSMSMGYVSKYIFGIGAAIALVCVAMAWYAEKVDIQRMNAQRWVWRQAFGNAGAPGSAKNKAAGKSVQRTDTNLSASSVPRFVFDAEKQERRVTGFAQQAIALVRTKSANRV